MADKVYLIVEDDWELRGNGLGSVQDLQITPLRFLVDLGKQIPLKVTFMAEVMQQLTMRSLDGAYPHVQAAAEGWEEALRLAKSNGHDVQLHIHPQWLHAPHQDGFFFVNSHWNLATYPPEERQDMLDRGIVLLERLVRPLDPGYRVIGFKAGAWAMQPSEGLLEDLRDRGFRYVIGPGQGLHFRSEDLMVDYTGIEEDVRPYYPDPKAVERLGPPGEIAVLPMPFVKLGLLGGLIKARAGLQRRRKPRRAAEDAAAAPAAIRQVAPARPVGDPRSLKHVLTASRNLDVGAATFPELKFAFDQVFERCIRAPGKAVPLVLQSHTKGYRDNHRDLARFYRYIFERYRDRVESLTLSELLERHHDLSVVGREGP